MPNADWDGQTDLRLLIILKRGCSYMCWKKNRSHKVEVKGLALEINTMAANTGPVEFHIQSC